ncbi:MAG: GxxExxY protein [Isosphaeraceae bacterium]
MEEGQINSIKERIIGGAIEVHRALGPGLLESAHEACLAHELRSRGLTWKRRRLSPSSTRASYLTAATELIYWCNRR